MKKQVFSLLSILLLMTGCGNETSKSDAKTSISDTSTATADEGTFELTKSAVLLQKEGSTFDLKTCFTLTDGDESKVSYSVDDDTIATVDADGVVTAKKEGEAVATITYAGEKYEVDILVFDYTGTYGASKYVDAMKCDLNVQLDLSDDGKFEYYRGAMDINVEGMGGKMSLPEATFNGTYTIDGNVFGFVFDAAEDGYYDFDLTFKIDSDKGAMLSGSVPTGGAVSKLELIAGVSVKTTTSD